MKEFPTFADAVIRNSLDFHTLLGKIGDYSAIEIRKKIQSAKKFILDDQFTNGLAEEYDKELDSFNNLLDVKRLNARSLFPILWIEFDITILNKTFIKKDNFPLYGTHDNEEFKTIGYLIEQHPKENTAYRITSIYDAGGIVPFEGTIVYQTSNKEAPIFENIKQPCKHLFDSSIYYSWPRNEDPVETQIYCLLIPVILILSIMSDIPTEQQVVPESTKGYRARGKSHKFVEHTILKLKVPQKVYEPALEPLSEPIQKREHLVRGHWRMMTHLAKIQCEADKHVWKHFSQRHHKCINCDVYRVWIKDQKRGDKTLGTITHDYQISVGDQE